jgi:hypothetical protein
LLHERQLVDQNRTSIQGPLCAKSRRLATGC